jgi:hypothetical protein
MYWAFKKREKGAGFLFFALASLLFLTFSITIMAQSVADMQVFFMGLLHEHDHTFACKSTDQLSSLWAGR